jgi:hypothetical protein
MKNQLNTLFILNLFRMLKGVVSFIILIKLPRHISTANCHLQGVTSSLQATSFLSASRVDVGYGSLGVASRHGGRNMSPV